MALLDPHRLPHGPIPGSLHFLQPVGLHDELLTLEASRGYGRCGSHHNALHRKENLTAAEMGNPPAVIFRHYRAVVKSEAAA